MIDELRKVDAGDELHRCECMVTGDTELLQLCDLGMIQAAVELRCHGDLGGGRRPRYKGWMESLDRKVSIHARDAVDLGAIDLPSGSTA